LRLDDILAYQRYHRKDENCLTALGLLKYTLADRETDKVGQIAHTDAGSLSIVFTEVGGLQVLKPNEDQWYYIAPKPGHAVVNVGDALRFISGGILESALHRIIPHKDEKMRHKYSIVYLLRPEMEAEFTDAEGVTWKGFEWTNKKHAVFAASAEEQAQGTYAPFPSCSCGTCFKSECIIILEAQQNRLEQPITSRGQGASFPKQATLRDQLAFFTQKYSSGVSIVIRPCGKLGYQTVL